MRAQSVLPIAFRALVAAADAADRDPRPALSLDGIRRGYPKAGYLPDCLVDYALAAEAPHAGLPGLSAEDARALFRFEGQPGAP